MKSHHKLFTRSAILILSGFVVHNAGAIVLDFNSQAENQVITNQFAGQGVLISGSGGGLASGVAAVLFDTTNPFNDDAYDTRGGTNPLVLGDANIGDGDQDLMGPGYINWAGGNLRDPSSTGTGSTIGEDVGSSVGVGNILIIQEGNTLDPMNPGFIIPGTADDAGDATASFTLTFTTAINSFQLDWIDLDTLASAATYSFIFTDSSGPTDVTSEISFDQFNGELSGPDSRPVAFGDHFANRFPVLDLASIAAFSGDAALTQIDQVVIDMGGSGGFTNVNFTQVPEPSSYALLLGGLILGVTVTRRRRS